MSTSNLDMPTGEPRHMKFTYFRLITPLYLQKPTWDLATSFQRSEPECLL